MPRRCEGLAALSCLPVPLSPSHPLPTLFLSPELFCKCLSSCSQGWSSMAGQGAGASSRLSPTASKTFAAGPGALGGCPKGLPAAPPGQRLWDHLSHTWWSLRFLWSKCSRTPCASDHVHSRPGSGAAGKGCWARTQETWAPLSILPLTGCVTLGKPLPSLGCTLHIYKKGQLDQIFLKIPFSFDVLRSSEMRRTEKEIIITKGLE